MNIGGGLSYLVGLLDFWPGLKTKLAAVAAFALAVIAAWNDMAPLIGVDFTIVVPNAVNALVLALLGAGAANGLKRLSK